MNPVKQNWLVTLQSAKRCSVPIVAITSADPASTMRQVCATLNKDGRAYVQWDCIQGFMGRGQAGAAAVSRMTGGGENDESKLNPIAALQMLVNPTNGLPADGVCFIQMAPRYITETPVIQALWNIRDEFKADQRTLILLGRQITLPPELENDVVVIDEPLPGKSQLREIVEQQYKNAGVTKVMDANVVNHSAEALQGLSAFAAEQLAAMNISKTGMDTDQLWDAKCRTIEATPGLKVFREGGRFCDIGGYDVLKNFISRILQGAEKPNAIVFVDEIEKMISGAGGDTSGVSQDQLGTILQDMQDNRSEGIILLGHPGGGKSAIAKASGNEAGIPTIQLDLGAAKGSLVGQSEQQLRSALKVIKSVSNGRALWIATCNSINSLPPELRRRFKLGVFMVDIPNAEGREKIWKLYEARYNVKRNGFAGDMDWTGAEIENCCHIANRMSCSIAEAAEFIVPIIRSAPEAVQNLRKLADGRFLSASEPGVYRMPGKPQASVAEASGTRQIALEA